MGDAIFSLIVIALGFIIRYYYLKFLAHFYWKGFLKKQERERRLEKLRQEYLARKNEKPWLK